MAAIRRTRTHDWLAHVVVMAGVWDRDHSGSTRPANCCRLSHSNSVAWDLSRNVGSQVEGLDGQVSEVSPPTALKSLTQVVAVTRQQISHPGPSNDSGRRMIMPQSSASIASKRSTVRARWVVAPLHPLSTACESAELSTRIVAHLDPVLARVREISARLLISEAIEGLGHQIQDLVSDAPSWPSRPTNTSSFAIRRHSAKVRAVCAFDPGSSGVSILVS